MVVRDYRSMPTDQNPKNGLFKTRYRALIRLAGGLLLMLCAAVATADEQPEIEANISASEIFVGESIDLQIEIRNVNAPSSPDTSAISQQFEVSASGNQSRNQSSTFIINGRVSQQNVLSHVYVYRLTPKVSGELTIPSATVTIDGQTFSSNPVRLRVLEPEPQDLVIAEIRTSQPAVYPTQPFTVTLRVLVQPLPDDDTTDPLAPLRRRPPHLQVNWADAPSGLTADDKSQWLQPLLASDGIGFTLNDINTRSGSIFDGPRAAVFALSTGREQRNGIDGRSINYFVYELSRTFTPQQTGTISFGPAVVKGTFVAAVEGNEYTARRLAAIAPAMPLEVREIPSPRPATFCGAIGEYRVTASASPTKLRVGDPLTLTLELHRGSTSGSPELISAPDLSSIPGLAEDFDIIDRSPTGRTEGSVKRFAYAMRPRRGGVTLPELTVTTFDPQSEKFVNILTAAIPLEVTEASAIGLNELVGSVSDAGSSDIKIRTQGIFQNITDLSEVRNERIRPSVCIQLVVGSWLSSAGIIFGILTYRRKSTDAVWQRRQQARRNAARRMQSARQLQTQGQARAAMQEVRMALIGLIADTRNLITEGLTTNEVLAALKLASVSADDQKAVSRLLESIESAQYGASDVMSSAAADAVATAEPLIERICPCLERRS